MVGATNSTITMKRANLGLAIALTCGPVVPLNAQGDLNPPAGPTAPTQKTLQQIEPRTDVATLPGDTNYHHIIDAPGSYYLTGNLEATLTHGVDIRAGGVTLDLGGFSISRSDAVTGNGVELSSGLNCIAVKNGSISGFAKGISLTNNAACRLTRLQIQGGTIGLSFTLNCKANLVLDCAITGTSAEGIKFLTGTGGGAGGSCDTNLVQRCTVTKTEGIAIDFDAGNTGSAIGNAVLDSTITSTGVSRAGIRFSGGNAQMNGNIVSKCTLEETGGPAVQLSAFSAFADGNILSDLTIRRAGGYGVQLLSPSGGNVRGNLLQRLTISNPSGPYANLETIQGGNVSGNVVRDCVGRDSGIIGLHCDGGPTGSADYNRFDGNHFTRTRPLLVLGSHYAIRTENSSGNFVWRNTASGYAHSFGIDPSDTTGPTVTTAGTLNASGGNDHPWANFSR